MRFGSWRKKSEVERERKKLGERAEGNQLSGGGSVPDSCPLKVTPPVLSMSDLAMLMHRKIL